MQNAVMGRNLTVDHKLSARTAPEMYAEFKRLVQDLELSGMKFRDRKVGLESVLNAILLEFFDLSPEQREEVIRRNVPRFEAVMDSDKPVALPVPWGANPAPLQASATVSVDPRTGRVIDDSARPTKKKRSG